jgi:hypothetical protein
MVLPSADVELPTDAELIADLETWRRNGVLKLAKLRLAALGRACQACGLADTAAEAAQPPVLKELVRSALTQVGGSMSGRCALVLLGLDANTFDLAPNLLREDAAEIVGVGVERFRREPQQQVLQVTADCVLELCRSHRTRLARLAMEQRHPADSRLAVHWLERFEAYFRIWTQVYALGADLTAYRQTLIDPSRPWDQLPDEDDPADLGYTQEDQAMGYGTFALVRHAMALRAEQHFIDRFGGLWLLSSSTAEAEARDALAAIRASLPTNERDHSWLRTAAQADHEMHEFLLALQDDPIGKATRKEWQDWLSACQCKWTAEQHDPSIEYFPTARYHGEIVPACPTHQAIEACSRFCALIEQEWLKVADWYSIPSTR